MQSPTIGTPVSKNLDLSSYSAQMLGKFSANAALLALAERMSTGGSELAAAQDAYEKAVEDILPARVDVKYANFISDRRVRLTQQRAEIADGKRGGRIAGMILPKGSAAITKLLGPTQVEAMIDLEGRLAAAIPFWPEAQAEQIEIAAHRKQYEQALKNRTLAGQKARDARAVRNAAKEKFLLMYAEVMSRVAAEFPRDKTMQELFFDEVRTKSTFAIADGSAEPEAESALG